MALVSAVETDSISCKQSSHSCGKWHQTSAKKKMGMIRDEHPSVTDRFRLGQEFCEMFKKILAISITKKYLATLYPPDRNVMQTPGASNKANLGM